MTQSVRNSIIVESRKKFYTRELLIIAVLIVLFVLTIDFLFYSQTLEDAFISFRYSQHLGEGYGFGAWNTNSERVEGCTTFLWMLVLALSKLLNLQIATLSKIIGIASHLILSLLFLFFPLICKNDIEKTDPLLGRHRDVFIFSSIMLTFYLPLSWYASTGMETMSFILLVSLGFLVPFCAKGTIVVTVIGIALVLMRPEGLIFAGACNLFHLLRRRQLQQPMWPILTAIIAVIATFFALTVFRLVVFGEIFPNTYYAKAAGAGIMHIVFGIRYIASWVFNHQLLFFFLALTVYFCVLSVYRDGLKKHLSLVFLLAFTAAYTLYIVKVGGDESAAFPYWRHILHQFPFLAILLGVGIVSLIPNLRFLRFLVLAITLLLVNCQILRLHRYRMFTDATYGTKHYLTFTHTPHNEYYLWLSQISDSNTVIASSLGGELPFVVDAVHIDMLGLNEYHIAHYGHFDPDGPVDSKTDMSWVLERRPDILEGYISGSKIIEGKPKSSIVTNRKRMVQNLLNHPIFKSEYLFLVNGPYEHIDRAIFIHRSYWENHSLQRELHCIPVASTGLYSP